MKKASVFISLLCCANLSAMDWSKSSFNTSKKEKRSSYNANFNLTDSSSELYTQVMCTPKKKEKKPNDKFKILCKKFMYFQLVTNPNLRSLNADELTSFYITLDLSGRAIKNLRNYLKESVFAFHLSTGKKPKQKDLEAFSVHIMDLSNNRLSSLPKGFTQVAQCVKWVDISKNRFDEVPPVFELCKSLKFLNIVENGIKSIPDWTDRFAVQPPHAKTKKNDSKSEKTKN